MLRQVTLHGRITWVGLQGMQDKWASGEIGKVDCVGSVWRLQMGAKK